MKANWWKMEVPPKSGTHSPTDYWEITESNPSSAFVWTSTPTPTCWRRICHCSCSRSANWWEIEEPPKCGTHSPSGALRKIDCWEIIDSAAVAPPERGRQPTIACRRQMFHCSWRRRIDCSALWVLCHNSLCWSPSSSWACLLYSVACPWRGSSSWWSRGSLVG